MIPRPDAALRMLAQRVLKTLLPDLGSAYARSDGGMTAMLLGYLAGEMESGISRRLADISEMRQILALAREAGLAMVDPDPDEPAALTLSAVNACHGELTVALISLQAALETDPCPAPEISAAIWRYLDRHSRRHQLD